MRIVQKIIKAGRTLMLTQTPDRRSIRKGRAPRRKPTPEAVRKNNWRLAAWKLIAIINANFGPGDHFLTLTYANEPESEAAARKIIDRHIERHRRWANRHGLVWRWIVITEHKGCRTHHHLLTGGIPMDRIVDGWTKEQGMVYVEALDNSGEYSRLANYIPKEGEDLENPGYKHKFRRSRKLVVPKPERIIQRKPVVMEAPPEVPHGYELVKYSEEEYTEPFFGSRVRRFILRRLDGTPDVMPYDTVLCSYEPVRRVPSEKQMSLWE